MVCVHLIDRNSGRPAQCLVQQEIGNVVDHVGEMSPNTKIRNTGDKAHKYRQLIDHYYRVTSFCTLFSAVSRHIFVVNSRSYNRRVWWQGGYVCELGLFRSVSSESARRRYCMIPFSGHHNDCYLHTTMNCQSVTLYKTSILRRLCWIGLFQACK